MEALSTSMQQLTITHQVKWGDSAVYDISDLPDTMSAIQKWYAINIKRRLCDIIEREREEGEVNDDEYNHD